MKGLRYVQYIALALGIALLLFWGLAQVHRTMSRSSDLQRFEEARRELAERPPTPTAVHAVTPEPTRTLPSELPVDPSLWSADRVKGYEESLEHDLGLPLAVLRISRIGLEVPVLAGIDELTLNRAVGHIAGTALPGDDGNVAIAGHRDGFFRGLKDVEVGDRLELETLTGSATYVISDLLIVDPQDVYVLAPTQIPTVTLVTCYPFYYVGKAPRRFIVQARLETPTEATDASAG
jgi:LPXTG-site transpeptidase (sortase) family protein